MFEEVKILARRTKICICPSRNRSDQLLLPAAHSQFISQLYVSNCCVQTIFEADPRHWQSGAIRSRLGNPGDIPMLPFMRATVQSVVMDLGLLEKSGATYMEFNAGGVACDDLRLAYSKIMTEYEVYKEDTFEESTDVS